MSQSHAASKFPLLSYLALVALFAPMLTIVVVWGWLVIASYLAGSGQAGLKEMLGQAMPVALVGAAICLASEWIIIPLLVAGGRRRPPYGVALSLGVGAGVAAAAFVAIRLAHGARALLDAVVFPG